RLWLDFTSRKSVDCFVEIGRVVPEYEVDAHFAQDTLHRLNLIGFHTDANHHHLSARLDHTERLAQRALDAHTFKNEVAAAASDFAHLVGGILRVGIHYDIRAQPACQFTSSSGQFRYY